MSDVGRMIKELKMALDSTHLAMYNLHVRCVMLSYTIKNLHEALLDLKSQMKHDKKCAKLVFRLWKGNRDA